MGKDGFILNRCSIRLTGDARIEQLVFISVCKEYKPSSALQALLEEPLFRVFFWLQIPIVFFLLKFLNIGP